MPVIEEAYGPYVKGANINPLFKDRISMMVAVNKKGYIGKDGQQIWVNPEDRQYFRRTTCGHTVLMGRKTFESMGSKPLDQRVNIVVSKTLPLETPGVIVVRSAEEALRAYYARGKNCLFVIGGAEIYAQFLPLAQNILLTQAEDTTEGDTGLGFKINEQEWKLASAMGINRKSGEVIELSHTHIHLVRREANDTPAGENKPVDNTVSEVAGGTKESKAD